MGVSDVAPNSTVAPGWNPTPLTVKANSAAVAVRTTGLSNVMVNRPMMKSTAFDNPPSGFVTVIGTVPTWVIKSGVTVTTNWEPFDEIGRNAIVPKFTTAPLRNPLPVTVRGNAGPPATVFVGSSEMINGVDLTTTLIPTGTLGFWAPPAVMVTVSL